jgi:hypothetical protein
VTSAPPIELKRHCRELSREETDGVVDVVADLIVSFLKSRSGRVAPNGGTQSGKEEARRGVPQAIGNER